MQTLASIELVRLEDPTSSATHPSPFLKWAGGKRHLLKHLLPIVPRNIISYYEPFLGGGSLFFALCRQKLRFRGFLSDLNSQLTDAYNVVRSSPEELVRHLT